MATILNACLRQATESFEIAQSTKEDDGLGYLGDLMRGNEIIRVTGVLARGDLEERLALEKHTSEAYRTAHKILDLITREAGLLPSQPLTRENCSMDQYEAGIREISEMAREGSAARVRGELRDFADSSRAYPRTDAEIQRMIRCKKETQYLTDLMDVCLDIEALYNPQPQFTDDQLVFPLPPTRGKIDRLKERLKELDAGRNLKALETAKIQLSELELAAPKPPQFFADLHPKLLEPTPQPLSIQKQSSWSGRTWVCLSAAALLAIAVGVLCIRK